MKRHRWLAAFHLSYFSGPVKIPTRERIVKARSNRNGRRLQTLRIPIGNEILDIRRNGEDQVNEFKAAGTDVRKITKEIAAMLHNRAGGMILYGVDDDGTIRGTDVSRQKFDQPLQNSVKNSINPAATVSLAAVSVMGTEVLVVAVPPWNRRDVYQFDEKVYLRKGTNVFGVKPEESRRLHRGEYVV